MIKVLFVCMGNICRSPMAEAVFKHLVGQAGLSEQFYIDSVGTDAYHVGEPAHHGTRRILAKHHIPYEGVARQVTLADLTETDYVVVMDRHNASALQRLMPGDGLKGRLSLLLSFATDRRKAQILDVPDPYYTGNFEEVYRLVEDGCRGLLAHIRQERGF